MIDPIQELSYIEFDGQQATVVRQPVITETPWALYINGREWLTFMCSPVGLHHLALGFMLSEGLIAGLDDLLKLKVHLDEHRVYMLFPDAGLDGELRMQACEEAVGSIDVRLRNAPPHRPEKRILTSGCGGGITFDDLSGDRPPLLSDLRITPAQISALMRQLHEAAALYRASRGVHSSALASTEGLLAVAEDVGRHNTLDKLRGAALLAGLPTRDRVLISSGRISSEMITKARKMEVPIVVSRTSPTLVSIRLALAWNMTLVGYVRGRQMRIYAGAERVRFEGAAEVGGPGNRPSAAQGEGRR
ncbi:MAG: formate dehydrogenase accessory sulfurtransferase FdhD [Chloroflexales bacterium]|nr:formate dehydrogenase accessory sulfurtransferase FdhD [Chloroflexales bacterium]